MDTTPPQAPPAIVAAADQATATTLQRLSDSQQWLVDQQALLPDDFSLGKDKYLDAIDAFWHEAVVVDDTAMTRQQALARVVARVARDDAALLVGDSLLPTEALSMVRAATAAESTLPPTLHARMLRVGDMPLAGSLVLHDDQVPDLVLLFAPHSGWHAFGSLEQALGHVVPTSDTHEVFSEPQDGPLFGALAIQLVTRYTAGVEQVWERYAPLGQQALADALHGALDLHQFVDIYDIAAWRTTMADAAFLRHANAVVGIGDIVLPHAIETSYVSSAGSAWGRRISLGLRTPALRRDFAHADTLFDKRYIARGVAAAQGAESAEGIFRIRQANYIRQDGQFYQVRFDAGMRGWRLTRAGALDAQFSGPLIERLPGGRWQVQRAGLLGGQPKGTGPYHVSAEDWELYRGYLSEALGDFHVTEYMLLRQRMARALGTREETVFNALGMRRPVNAAPIHVAAEEAELFQTHVAGIRELRSTRQTGYGTWRPEPAALERAQAQIMFPPLLNVTPDDFFLEFRARAMPLVADLSPNELRELIGDLQVRAGEANAIRIFTTLGRRPLPNETLLQVSPEELTHWTAALNHVRAMRSANPRLGELPGPSTAAPLAPAPRLELVPESEWPDVAYYYATAYEMEHFRHARTLTLSQVRPAQSPVQGIPLMTQSPETLLSQTGSVPDAWLPRTPMSRATLPPATTSLGQASGAWIRIELRRLLPPPTALGAHLGHPYRLYRQHTVDGPMLVLRQTNPPALGWWNPAVFFHEGNFSIHFWPAP
ncbi:hypothetical protein L2Y96_01980 [Luteibacter aegosomaticola]|uniref:hypothetical protein n=1 Tax=Luteibacter aegosomaticola TaxID=2911538 RepID=UPI001FFAAE5F|nr:hypothetical protein [Luteibacter aegosomaticola]UPG90562.1 hypothetical protein L2Y96_01980 [Luteibacter aegosomaticola]